MRFTGNRNVGSNPTLSARHGSQGFSTLRGHHENPEKTTESDCYRFSFSAAEA